MTREEAIRWLERIEERYIHGGDEVFDEARKEALHMAIEALECKHGEWIDGLDIPKEERERHPYVYLHGEKYCSVCYKEAYFDTDYGQQLFDFCPNCGADMRGDEDEHTN